ncbi:uncharacterized protein LOC134249063 isoform X2 [Saccostrea cucullata]|uniref:uncharacterized protein LOC134249063 isoform X2 n=1 Tax=Saccostrea cuccullata TaxID=36930 RepID=UPI002ED187FB
MESGIWIFILIFIPPFQTTTEKEYIYVEKEMTWSDALDFCEQNNSVLSALSKEGITSIETCNQSSTELWTSSFLYAPYLSIMGCFRNTKRLNFSSLMKPSILDCQDMCSNSSAFAIMNTWCACLDDNFSFMESEDAKACNITCEDKFDCGGKDSMNVYSVVGEDFFNKRQHQINPDLNTSCLSYQCLPVTNEYFYKDVDCSSEEVKEAACSTFFSCTFESGDPCFLSQVKNDNFDWTISDKTTIGQQEAYQGSYFAFVNDSSGDYQKRSRASLRSNIDFPDFKASDWCLRFWIYLQNISSGGFLEFYIKNCDDVLYNQTISAGQYSEWKYFENDIRVQRKDIIFFDYIRGTKETNIALDDITLTKGKCGNTFSTVLYMLGNLKCGFEGNKDTCFDQSNRDNFNWKITRNGQITPGRETGPSSSIEGNYFSHIDTSKTSQSNHKGVLISKFDLKDINITFSMEYNMYGTDINTLKVYLKNGRNERIFREKENQGKDWRLLNDTRKIEGRWKLYISANRKEGTLGDIAIDDIRIKINQPDLKLNWMNQNERCKEKLSSYAINHQQLPYLPCLSSESVRWTGIVRPHMRGTATNMLKKHPTKVKVYKNLSVNYAFVWVSFKPNSTRPFVCERKTNISRPKVFCVVMNEHNSVSKPNPVHIDSTSDTLVGVLVACALLIFLGILIFLFCYKWKKSNKHQNQRDTPSITTGNATYLNDSEKVFIQSKHGTENNSKAIEEIKQKKHQGKENNYSEQNEEDTANGMYDLSVGNDYFRKEPEEDYDHLHQVNNSMTSKTDDLYSHATGSQYESQKVINDDTYAHTVEIENEYGAPKMTCHDDNETYDHAHVLDVDPDGEYNLLHEVNRDNETLYNHV